MFTAFLNCRLCIDGELVEDQLVVSEDTGLILPRTGYIGGEAIDLEGAIIAPGYLELQTNGTIGIHFTRLTDPGTSRTSIEKVGQFLATQGVTGFWATVPTVSRAAFQQVLPNLRPRSISNGATLLGAHAEGPYLHPSKKGAHNEELFLGPDVEPTEVYGGLGASPDILKLVTLAPELGHVCQLVETLHRQGTRVSLGHSAASFEQGMKALEAGATCLTHTLNAMAPLHHRDPGLAGLAALQTSAACASPYFSMIPDGNHLHPSIVSMLFHTNPRKAIIITDSIELAGLEDGIHPGHGQIPFSQRKQGSRVTIDGTDTLIGGCASLQECVRNLVKWSGCSLAEAVRCATENIADLMGLQDRGKLEVGRRADFVVLDDTGEVLQTWIGGKLVWKER